MTYKKVIGLIFLIVFVSASPKTENDSRFLCYTTEASAITFYWKDDNGRPLRSLQNLKTWVETKKKELKFAMNGGMYNRDSSPKGLFIENSMVRKSLDTLSGTGNFYLKPNGVFYITKDNQAAVCPTDNFSDDGQIKFATQSGPMLLINGEIHPAFKKGSANVHIRNGVGILPDNRVIFAMSRQEVNFYDFAEFFKTMKCKNALYLDGFVSRTYLPAENWTQLDGDFGVIIGVAN